jgi:hypothetical protein
MRVFIPNRVKTGILAKVILSDSPENRIYHKIPDKEILKKSILINNPLFTIPDEVLIYDDKVAISLYTDRDMCGIIIHSAKFFETMESIFDLIWETQKNNKKDKK